MKITLFQIKENYKVQEQFVTLCDEYEFEIDDIHPDVVIYVGGDGTFLRAVEKYLYLADKVSFVGLNNGSLGYFYDYEIDDMESLFEDINSNHIYTHKYPLLRGIIEADTDYEIYAINEIRIENPFKTLVCEVFVDNDSLETFRGNGLIVSSTLGSTAYNKSLGGAVIDEDISLLQLTEIAPINNNKYRSLNSSLILNKEKIISFKIQDRESHIVVGYDHLTFTVDNIHSVTIHYANKMINMLRKKDYSFIDSMRRSFID